MGTAPQAPRWAQLLLMTVSLVALTVRFASRNTEAQRWASLTVTGVVVVLFLLNAQAGRLEHPRQAWALRVIALLNAVAAWLVFQTWPGG